MKGRRNENTQTFRYKKKQATSLCTVNGSGSGFLKIGMVIGEPFIYMIIEREGIFCFLNGL